ncbi:MAG: mini-circle protein [Acidimicrobiales bacterium]|nr:mini-circle protein [Acidimicrobiales bacterium]
MPVPFQGPPDELSGLTMFLDEQRAAILRKIDGVSEADAVRTTTVSSLSLLTLVKHLAFVERRWFRLAVAGRDEPGLWPPADPDEELRVDQGDTLASVRRLYEGVVAEAQAITAEAGDPDKPCDPSAEGLNLRWILLHMIEETARHAGHADIIREAIDGAKGP